ncbi:MAG TPA: hypothetical protein VF069_17510 [Streptosporangiaceae bacterium]
MAGREVLRADQEALPALGDSRARVLAVLQEAGEPLDVSQVARRVRLHANTARFHPAAGPAVIRLTPARPAARAWPAPTRPGSPRRCG